MGVSPITMFWLVLEFSPERFEIVFILFSGSSNSISMSDLSSQITLDINSMNIFAALLTGENSLWFSFKDFIVPSIFLHA